MKTLSGSLSNVLAKRHALGAVMLLSGLASAPAIALADVVTEPAAFIAIDASDTPVDDLLGQISASYGFAVERSGPKTDAVKLTGHYEGTVKEVVNRVLEDENHLIRYAKGQPNRIAKIVLMGQATRRSSTATVQYGTVASAPVPVPPSNVAEAAPTPAVVPQPPAAAPTVVSHLANRTLLQKVSAKVRPRASNRSRRGVRAQN